MTTPPPPPPAPPVGPVPGMPGSPQFDAMTRRRGSAGARSADPGSDDCDDPERALAFAAFERGDLSEAERLLYQLLRNFPNDSQLLACYGIALKRRGRYADALKVLRKAQAIRDEPLIQQAIADAERLLDNDAKRPLGNDAERPPTAGAQRGEAGATSPAPDQPRSLATELDKPSALAASSKKRGELRFVMRRRASSFRRFWFGPLLTLVSVAVANILGRSHSNNLGDVYLALDAVALLGPLLFISAFVAKRYTTYTVYDRRIDFGRGIFSRRADSRWLYDITRLEFRQPPLLTLTGTGRIEMDLDTSPSHLEHDRIVATGNTESMKSFMEELQDNALQERRAMKGIWT